VAHGAKVDVASVGDGAEVPLGRQPVGVPGVVCCKGAEVGSRAPLRNERLQRLGAGDGDVHMGCDGEGVCGGEAQLERGALFGAQTVGGMVAHSRFTG
ncbi:MAG: hypothetical protein ACPGRY_02165, partial [Candidatus Latescibacterota bacterium]